MIGNNGMNEKMIPDGYIFSDIMLMVMIVLFMGSICLMVLTLFINEAINAVIRIKRELIEEEKEVKE